MKNPQWQDRDGDDLTGSPELFATNLLLVRAMDNRLSRIEVNRHEDRVGVQLFSSERDYEEETLTEQLDTWPKIVDRFEEITDFEEPGETGRLNPTIPVDDAVTAMKVRYDEGQITLSFTYED